jgi:uncharacterized membrane protein
MIKKLWRIMKTKIFFDKRLKYALLIGFIGIIVLYLLFVGGALLNLQLKPIVLGFWLYLGVGLILISLIMQIYFAIIDREFREKWFEIDAINLILESQDEREQYVKYQSGYYAFITLMILLGILFPLTGALQNIIQAFDQKVILNGIFVALLLIGLIGLSVFYIFMHKNGIEWQNKNKKSKE